MKLCSKCKLNEAATSVYNGSYCKPCRNSYQAKYAKATRYASAKRSHNKIKDLIRKIKSVSCLDCKVTYPWYVMDFDHVRGTKKFNLATAPARQSKTKILEEIAKCDIVCSNCHRERTFNRKIPV